MAAMGRTRGGVCGLHRGGHRALALAGREVLAEIKADDDLRIIPVIILIVPALLILLQNDTGSAIVYASLVLVLYRRFHPDCRRTSCRWMHERACDFRGHSISVQQPRFRRNGFCRIPDHWKTVLPESSKIGNNLLLFNNIQKSLV